MSNLQHIKGSRTRVLNTFPTKTFGKDGDIVISRINGKGVFLCSKAGGMWYAANKMQELNKLEKTSIRELTTNKLTINKMINTERSADRFVVNDGGNIKYRTGEQVVGDLPLPFDNIAYKTAYCSLGQYSDKDSCESNGGTWYYSENDSHDSISSTAENQLLTVGQSIGGVDAESTLTYDGSTLEIKYNSDYDDNWQTSATIDLLKLSYDSSKNAIFNVSDAGRLTIDCTNDIILDADGGDVTITDNGESHFHFSCDNTAMTIYDDTNSGDLFSITVGANGATTLTTNDNDGLAGHLTLDVNGDLILDTTTGITKFYRAGDTDDLCTLQVSADGATTIATSDSDGTAGTLTLAPNGALKLTPSSGIMNFYASGNEDDYADIRVGGDGELTITTVDAAAAAAHLTLVPDGDLRLDPGSKKIIINATDKLYFDGGGDTHIHEVSGDKLDTVAGGHTITEIYGDTSDATGASDYLAIQTKNRLYFDGGGDTYILEQSADALRVVVGGDIMMHMSESGVNGNNILFYSGSVGFTRRSATFSATTVIGSGGTDDTDIDFRFSNKFMLEMTGDITTINLIFPLASGNFLLVCTTNGDHDVTNWKAWESDESAATTADVLWAGGSVPAFTSSGVDIVSFYWDTIEQKCYGTASLAFATP